jgi:IS5 family transposase
MLTLLAGQPESLWDEALPVEVKELPADLAALDGLLADPGLLGPIVERFRREVIEDRRAVLTDGRPTIAMETYIRLMVLKARYRWGYRSLVAEVSDSIHLRRFCRISLSERVPDESTVRKLTRRIGADTVNAITRALIVEATRSKRFRPRAVRIDSTVIEADVRYPTDAGLAAHGVRTLAREAKKLAKLVKEQKRRVRDRSRSMGRTLRAVTRTIRRRSGEAKSEVLKLTERTGELLESSIAETRRLVVIGAPAGAWSWREGEAEGGREPGGVGRSVREGRQADQAAGRWGVDQGPLGVAGRSGRPADPEGQVGQAERIWVRQSALRGDGEHPTWCARAGLAGRDCDREPGRGHAPAPHDRGAQAARDLPERDRARRRVQHRPDDHGRRRPRTGAGVHLRPPATRLQTHPTTDAALPNRRRRQDQPPQTQLQAGPIPPQRRRRPADLDRMGDPRLQR